MSDGVDAHRDMIEALEIKSIMDEKSKIAIALRRAKVEVLERAAMEVCTRCNDPENWAPMSNSGYHLHNKSGRHLLARCYATKIHALKHALNAHATQIEDGKSPSNLNEWPRSIDRRQKPKDTY